MEIIDARWPTSLELEKFKKFKQNKCSKEQQISYLNQNLNDILFAYREYPKQVLKEAKTRYEAFYLRKHESIQKWILEYYDRVKKFNDVKAGKEIPCECGGQMQWVNYNGSGFVGCTNYRDKTVSHSSTQLNWIPETPPSIDKITSFEHWLKDQNLFPKQYITKFKKWAKIPDYIQASVLFEWLIANEQEIYNDELERDFYYQNSQVSIISHIQETVCAEKLKDVFENVLAQKLIMVKTHEFNYYQYRRPDFICWSGSKFYVVEVKKNIHNYNEEQVQEYRDALQIIADKKQSGLKVKHLTIFYDLDFLDCKLPEYTTHIQTLTSYEFN